MLNIKVTPSFKRVGNVFKQIKLGPAIQEGIEAMAREVEGASKKETPVDTGMLRGSIQTKVRTLQAIVEPRKKYAIFVHEGTRPHWPPIGAIEGWARRHGIEPFLVARAIARHGTKARPFMREGLEVARHKILGSRNPVFKRVKKYIEMEVKKI